MEQRAVWSIGCLLTAWLIFFWNTLVSIAQGSGQAWVSLLSFGIVLAAFFLVYQKRNQLSQVIFTSSQLGLLCLFLLVTGYIVSAVAHVTYVEQTAVILMLPALVLTACGPEVVRVLLFPLLYVLWIIPLQDDTLAQRYLVTWVSFGLLFAYLRYSALPYRIIFVILSCLLPFIFIAGTDHLFSGSFYLPFIELGASVLVLGSLVLITTFMKEPVLKPVIEKPMTLERQKEIWVMQNARWLAPTLIAFSMLMTSPWLSENIREFYPIAPKPIVLKMPPGVDGWLGPFEPKGIAWKAEYPNASAVAQAEYFEKGEMDPAIHVIYAYSAYYQSDRSINDLLAPTNLIYNPDFWKQSSVVPLNVSLEKNTSFAVLESTLTEEGITRLVWYWYHIIGVNTIDLNLAKILDNVRIVSKYADGSGIVAISTLVDSSTERARERLKSFLNVMSPSLESLKHPENRLQPMGYKVIWSI